MFDAVATAFGASFERAPWGWGLLALCISAFVKLRPLMAKIAMDREETALAARAEDNAELRDRVAKLEAKLEAKDVQHEAERALDRHRLNNMDQVLTYLFLAFEASPEKAPELIAQVKQLRAQQIEREAVEKAAIHAARIAATGDQP